MIERQQDVTVAATSVMKRTSDPRLREIMLSLVKHLHGFVRDVRLTEAEFREAAAIVGELGKLSTDTRNEVILMAGSLGVSSLVCLLNNGDQGIPRPRNPCSARFGGCTPLMSKTAAPSSAPRHPVQRCSSTRVWWIRPAIRSRAPKWTCGTPRRLVFTKIRIPNRPT
jgi:hypothetical protein